MCKTGTTPKRPAGFAAALAAEASGPSAEISSSSTAVNAQQFFSPQSLLSAAPGFFPFQSAAGLPEIGKVTPMGLAPASLPTPTSSLFLQQQQLNRFPSSLSRLSFPPTPSHSWFPTLPQFTPTASSQLQAQMDLLGRAAAITNLMQQQQQLSVPTISPANRFGPLSGLPASELGTPIKLDSAPLAAKSLKRSLPEIVSDSNSENSGPDTERNQKQAKVEKPAKRKHEATLDGERRVAIEFERLGSIGEHPQTYGKGALIVPDGVCGKYSAFGQRWRFTISHAVGPVICEDGVQRMCLSWSITNLNSGVTHTVVETPSDAMKRDRDGKTLCNRVFRDALSLRASALEAELRNTTDSAACVDLQSQLRTIQTKRFSEGPLFFGLRHCSLQQELRKELSARNASATLLRAAAVASDGQVSSILGAPQPASVTL